MLSRYNLAKQAKSRRSKDGDSMLKQCSRDGQTEKLAKCIGELCWQHKSIKAESENLEFVCVDSAGVSYRKSTAMQDRQVSAYSNGTSFILQRCRLQSRACFVCTRDKL